MRMKTAVLLAVLSVAPLCAQGVCDATERQSGTVKMTCFMLPIKLLGQLGAPIIVGTPENLLNVWVSSSDPTVTGFLVTVRYSHNAVSNTLRATAANSTHGTAAFFSLPAEGLPISAVTVDELRTSATSSFTR